ARGGGTAGLFTAINRQTQRILAGFTERWGLGQIEKLSVSGNTTMLHLFLNIDPSGMGEYPFTPVFLDAREMPGHGLSFSAKSVSVLPSISAFVGGDITAGLAALDILNAPDPSLLIDIGTNGEMALFHRGGVYCCATAAGPAFEGAEISCGMSGISGAISAVELASDGSLSVTTIGGQPPRGVCGSGLIDAVAVMLKQGVIDETGLMENHPAGYPLACGVSIVNRDIRQFQLAKSAIFSGVKILCKNAGVATDDIKNVYIAGGFGFFINKKNSSYVGLFPKDFADRLSICGNLSLQGAEEALLSKDFMERCGQIISRCSVVDLSADPDFMNEFAENMLFDP
ncbi:MAG: ASKHA domain-containing protein, partial [Spirochaetes bacterium]|nr:ASKHA domain-containing protein [Spirochaetota bacterium]